MVEPIIVTLLAVCFLAVLFGGGVLLRRRSIDVDGEPPIDRRLFYASKYSILLVWAAMVAAAWGVRSSFVEGPRILKWVSLALWGSGFALLFIGRLGLGESFRMGSPRESTRLRVGGLFAVSRDPMYVGVYATVLASALYTLNPVVLILAAVVVGVHHRIVLAEEEYLQRTFGDQYTGYCRRVRRYL